VEWKVKNFFLSLIFNQAFCLFAEKQEPQLDLQNESIGIIHQDISNQEKQNSPNEKVWTDHLKGIVFYDTPDTKLEDFCMLEGVQLKMNVIDEQKFIDAMSRFLQQPFSAETIQDLKREVIHFYQKRGFPIIGVFVPAGQDIACGTVSVLILVGKLGSVHAEGARYFSNEKIASKLRIKPGEIIQSAPINQDLVWINQNLFRSTSLIYEPGNALGETNITLVTKDRVPIRVYGGFENTGNPLTKTPRFLGGINLGNVFGQEHQLNYLFISETQPKIWYAHVGSYAIPLPWRDIFKVYGSYTHTRPSSDAGVNMSGKGWQICGRYSIPLTISSWDSEFFVGYEFKRTNNFLSFGVQSVFNNFIDISQFALGYEGKLNDQRSTTSFGIIVYLSPGNMTAFNKTSCFQTERAGAKSSYYYGKIHVDEILELPHRFSWVMNGVFQLANGKLLPSEEFPLGGYYTVRGYEEYEVISESGLLLKNELRFPSIHISGKDKKHELQFLGFVDFGLSLIDDPHVVENHATILASAGPALRYNFNDHVLIRIDYGGQLSSVNNIATHSHRHSRLHVGAQIAF